MVNNPNDPVFDRVVWNGTMAREGTSTITMVGDRVTRPGDLWQAPARLYNRTGKFKRKAKEQSADQGGLDNRIEGVENPGLIEMGANEPVVTTFGDEGE